MIPQHKISHRAWLVALHAAGACSKATQTCLLDTPGLGTLLAASPSELMAYGLSRRVAQRLYRPDWRAIEQDLAWLAVSGHALVTQQDAAYPALLKETASPPLCLFVRGDRAVLSLPQLAMVGSRNPTPTAVDTAQAFARALVRAGVTITSGLALGIDAASHQGALAGGGKTIAVLGTGVDRIYPARHRGLAEAIVEQGGALVSEFPIGMPPKRSHFPLRNRIVSGMSMGALVVEAALRSGSLITARLALEQGREVFAVPGSIHNPRVRGCHAMIQQGAKLVGSVADILEELGPLAAVAKTEPEQIKASSGLDADYGMLLESVDFAVTATDHLVQRTGFPARVVASMLLQLTLRGDVLAVPGGYIRRGMTQTKG